VFLRFEPGEQHENVPIRCPIRFEPGEQHENVPMRCPIRFEPGEQHENVPMRCPIHQFHLFFREKCAFLDPHMPHC